MPTRKQRPPDDRAPGTGLPLFNILDYWTPGQQVAPWPPDADELTRRVGGYRDPAEYAGRVAFLRRNMGTAKLVMVAFASTATPINTVQAVTYQQQARIARRAGLSIRQVARYLEHLTWLDEIESVPCDGRACYGRHRRTPHYIINNPPAAPLFDAVAAARKRRQRQNRGS